MDISGTVTAAETGVGVEGITLEISVVAPGSRAVRRRLGTVATGRSGEFSFATRRLPKDGAVGRSVEAGRVSASEGSLHIAVLGPDVKEPIAVREIHEPGDTEHVAITLSNAELDEHGLGQATKTRRRENESRLRAQLDLGEAELRRAAQHETLKVTLERNLASKARGREHRQSIMAKLSGVDAEIRDSDRFVAPGQDVREVSLASMSRGIKETISKTTMEGAFALSESQLSKLQLEAGVVPSSKTEAFEVAIRPAPVLQARFDPASLCKKFAPPEHECITPGDGTPADEPKPADDTAADAPVADEDGPASDVQALVHAMMDDLVAANGGIGGRAGLEQIRASIEDFQLKSGPADVPAHHDFQRLQIAFEPVWVELFDQDVLGKGEAAYEQLVELGMDPNKYFIDWRGDDLNLNFGGSSGGASGKSGEPDSRPGVRVVSVFDVTPQQWKVLTPHERNSLTAYAAAYLDVKHLPLTEEITIWGDLRIKIPVDENTVRERERQARALRTEGLGLLAWADKQIEQGDLFDRYHDTLAALSSSLKQAYRFSVYAANRANRSINFGIVSNYRQVWDPVTYQPGRLVKTIPLAPRESRRYSKKTTQTRSRSRREIDNSLSAKRTESSQATRAEADIVERAKSKTNFDANVSGFVNFGIAGGGTGQAFGQRSEAESAETKRQFREAILKSAQEFKNERTVEVNAGETDDLSAEESGEIVNPNDELTVTYLFYELERRYRVSEHLQSVTPVVMVAQEMPEPHEIDEDWIIAHDWILRRAILDDSFLPALDYLASRMVGDEAELREMNTTLQQQRAVLEELTGKLSVLERESQRRYASLASSIETRAQLVDEEENESVLEDLFESVSPLGKSGASEEGMRIRESAARDAYDRASAAEKDLIARLEAETVGVAEMTKRYGAAVSAHLNRRTQIRRLQVHIKQNILHYMQAIWSYEPPDQRYFRLHEAWVPRIKGEKTYKVVNDPSNVPMPPDWEKPKRVTVKSDLDIDKVKFDRLSQVADLDNLLGFKGNYMIFALKEGNDLTDLMTMPYIDPAMGLRDPDPAGGWTLSQFSDYVCCLRRHMRPPEFEAIRGKLADAYQQILEGRGTGEEEITIPTGSLFIEALPGSHPILEDFKLIHRATDARLAISDVRARELENIRRAGRLLSEDFEDPDVDRRLVIEGDVDKSIVVDPDAPK